MISIIKTSIVGVVMFVIYSFRRLLSLKDNELVKEKNENNNKDVEIRILKSKHNQHKILSEYMKEKEKIDEIKLGNIKKKISVIDEGLEDKKIRIQKLREQAKKNRFNGVKDEEKTVTISI